MTRVDGAGVAPYVDRASGPTAMPVRAERIADRPMDGELVLYDPEAQQLHVLNPTAGLVWRLCDGRHNERLVVDALALRYPDSRPQIEQDVPRIIERFRAAKLLRS